VLEIGNHLTLVTSRGNHRPAAFDSTTVPGVAE
jgi:hypothetical protein